MGEKQMKVRTIRRYKVDAAGANIVRRGVEKDIQHSTVQTSQSTLEFIQFGGLDNRQCKPSVFMAQDLRAKFQHRAA